MSKARVISFNMNGSIEVSVYSQPLSSVDSFKYPRVLLWSHEKMHKAQSYEQDPNWFSAA